MICNGVRHCGTRVITVPMVDSFTSVISCGTNGWNIQLQDASIYLPAYAGYSITWSTTCGLLSSTTAPNPILTVSSGCNPTVTLTISKNGCTLSRSFTFNFPTTPLTIQGPSTVCVGQNNVFQSSDSIGVVGYAWNFGDATTGVTNPITHAYGSAGTFTMTLTITDTYGCPFTTTKPITVVVPTSLVINPSPLVKVCPDCLPPSVLTATSGFSGYQWFQNGTAIAGANSSTYQLCNLNATGNYYVTATSTNSCPATSNTVQVIYHPKPVAKIEGTTIRCVPASGPFTVYLYSLSDANYTYSWTSTSGTVVFSPNNTSSSTTVTAPSLGNYEIILTVIDNRTGCIAKDTFCVYFVLIPTLTIFPTPAAVCEGSPYTMTASATPLPILYQWSNGATTASITVTQAGNYSVTATNAETGCSTSALAGIIKLRPYLDLFPIGCDTLCDTVKIIPPLPLVHGQTYNGVYIISWYVDNSPTPVFTGPALSLTTLTPGPHQIYIVVTEISTGCSSTSGKYDVYVKHCGDCCPYVIRIDSTIVSYDTVTVPSATALIAYVNISGLSTANITEVRANVVNYIISDNYDKECMKCINYPYTWASFAAATAFRQTVGAVLPNITMYGGTSLRYFFGGGSFGNKYQNPREIIWNNGITFSIPNNTKLGLAFLLPPTPLIDCCELRGRVCVKLTFRDNECKECEEYVCFPFEIKKRTSRPLQNEMLQSKDFFLRK